MALSFVQIFRDYITNGVPSSGNHKPAKAEIRSWGAWVESIISSFLSNGGLVYTSRALLFADLAHAANSSAWVIGDATTAYNGVYMKAGASGTGSWTRVADLPYSFVQLIDAGAGTPNAIQLTSTIPTSQSVLRVANVFEANAGNVTVSENGGSAKSLLTSSGSQIAAAGLTAGMMIVYVDDGAAFRLLSDQASAAIQAAAAASASAAAGSASAASASAAAAAASAASVSLPAIAANRMLVDNAAGTSRDSKTFPQVMTLLAGAVSGVASAFSLDNNTLYKARSLKDRWLDSYRLAEELQFTGGGATATDAAVLQALFNRAKAAGRGEIILPRGDIALEASCLLANPGGTQPLRLVGQGPDETIFKNTSAAQQWLKIGDPAQAVSSGILLEGFGFSPAVAMSDAGSMLFARNMSRCTFKSLKFNGARNAVSLGVGASAQNDTVYTDMIDCGGSGINGSGVPIIRLASGAGLNIKGAGNWNGAGGQYFIRHEDPSYNWDGLYVYQLFAEQFDKFLYSSGTGVVNVEWTGGQVDRHLIGFHAEPAVANGSNRNWMIHHVQMLGGPTSAGIGVFTSIGSSTDNRAIENIRVQHNTFENHTDRAVWLVRGGGIIEGNTFDNCGYSGVPIIQIGQPITRGYAKVGNNVGFRHPSSAGAGYSYGIQWDGATHAQRSENDNRFYDYVSGQQNGSM
ncbi:hypothetical protein ACC717_05815 [Rhizobium ruizarguesonis]